MVTFECNSCGKCCESLGPYIVIERKMGARDFYCRNMITRELFQAHIQPEYADAFEKKSDEVEGKAPAGPAKTCVFLVKNPGIGGSGCAIYPARPRVCREFRCYHMNIYDETGGLRGKVIGRNEIKTLDTSLENFWKEYIIPIPCANRQGCRDSEWTRNVLSILAAHGYRGESVE